MALLPERISCEELVLRAWTMEAVSAAGIAISRSRSELRRWLPWADRELSQQELKQHAERFRKAFLADEYWFYLFWEGEEVVGGGGLGRQDEQDCLGIGYWVRSDRTGRGFATAAVRELTRVGFERLDWLRRVEIHMDMANLASAAIPPKLGFNLAGEVPREKLTPGHTGRGYVWELDRGLWERRSST